MKISGAIGLGLFIIFAKVFAPHVYMAFADFLIAFFDTLRESLDVTASIIDTVGHIPP